MTNALLLRRRGMMAGKTLPYDAQVEYLENGAKTEFIELPLSLSAGDWFEIMFTIEPIGKVYHATLFSSKPDNKQIGAYTATQNPTTQMNYATWCGGSQTSGGITVLYNNVNTIGFNVDGKWYYNGNFVALSRPLTDAVTSLTFFKGTLYTASHRMRLHHLQMSFGTAANLIYDLIPVRVGQVGYMYDRVSGQLFGNQGTGDFILGPDIQ